MPATASPSISSLPAVQRYFQISLYLLLLTSVLTLVSTGKLDLVTILAPPAALLVKGYRWWHGRGPELSSQAATALVLIYFVFFPIDLWFVSRTVSTDAQNPGLYSALLATIHLMLFAMAVRLFSASSTRDYLFLALLAFTCMLAAAILTVDTTFLAFFLVFLVLGVSTFVGLEMRRSAEGATTPPFEEGTPAAHRLHRALGLTSAAVAVSALAVGAVIFFVIPRFTAGYLSAFNLQPSLISGFSDDVELGQIGVIKKNSSVVMRVRVEGGPVRNLDLRWRGIALTTFDGKRWSTEVHDPTVLTPGAGGWYWLGIVSPATRRLSKSILYTILLEPMGTASLFLAPQVERLRGRFSAEPWTPRGRSYLVMDQTNSLFNPYHNYTDLRYEALSYIPQVPAAQLRAASTVYPEHIRATYLQLPALDPRIPELARQIAGSAADPFDIAVAVQRYLRSRYGYTLDLSGPPPADPLAYFLFGRRAGHCEYFAAAMTVMLRTLGIPARYINGFLPGEYNDVAGDYIVRASDAHSWVEVYFPEYGWIPFDPTPPSEVKATSWLGRLGLYWDAFEFAWSEWVINYDFNHWITLAQGVHKASRSWSDRARAELNWIRRKGIDELKYWQARLTKAPAAVGAAVGVLLLILLLRSGATRRWLALFWNLRVLPSTELTPRLATLQYRQMLRLLERRGLRKLAGQTPLEFVAALRDEELAAPVGQVTALYQETRFGERVGDPQRVAELLAGIKSLLHAQPRR